MLGYVSTISYASLCCGFVLRNEAIFLVSRHISLLSLAATLSARRSLRSESSWDFSLWFRYDTHVPISRHILPQNWAVNFNGSLSTFHPGMALRFATLGKVISTAEIHTSARQAKCIPDQCPTYVCDLGNFCQCIAKMADHRYLLNN